MNDINLEIQDTPNTDMEVQEQADIEFNLSDTPSIMEKNYNNLSNKPSINNVTLQGNKTSNDLGLVSKEVGKGLSTNDFTNALKEKLVNVEENYYNKTQTDNLLNEKQPNINDLSNIRSGASKGATSLQPNDNISELNNDVGYLSEHQSLNDYRKSADQDAIDEAIESDIYDIKELIPSQATSNNKLADKDYVNSSVSTNTAYFRGTFNIVTDLELSRSATHQQVATALSNKITTITNNDYVFVAIPSETIATQIEQYDRYKYTSGVGWSYEFTLNNSSFTAQQWSSINSGLSSNDKTKLDNIEDNAQVNVLEGLTINGGDLTISNKKAEIPIAKSNGMISDLGLVRFYRDYGIANDGTGCVYGVNKPYSSYKTLSNYLIIDKYTLEEVLDNETPRIDKEQSLTDVQKQQVKDNIGETQDVNALEKYVQSVYGGKFVEVFKNGDFSNATSNWNFNNEAVTYGVSNNILTINATQTTKGFYQSVNVVTGHKYLFKLNAKLASGKQIATRTNGFNVNFQTLTSNGDWQEHSFITTCTNSSGAWIYPVVSTTTSLNTDIQIKNIQLIDLTQLYGSGNEPTTIAQFKTDYPLDYYAYSLGNADYVEYSKVQSLSDAQKLQARTNIGTQKIWKGTTDPTQEVISEMAEGDIYVVYEE